MSSDFVSDAFAEAAARKDRHFRRLAVHQDDATHASISIDGPRRKAGVYACGGTEKGVQFFSRLEVAGKQVLMSTVVFSEESLGLAQKSDPAAEQFPDSALVADLRRLSLMEETSNSSEDAFFMRVPGGMVVTRVMNSGVSSCFVPVDWRRWSAPERG